MSWGLGDEHINAIDDMEITRFMATYAPAGVIITGSLPFGIEDNVGGYHHVIISIGDGQNIGLGPCGLILERTYDTARWWWTTRAGKYFNSPGTAPKPGARSSLPNPPPSTWYWDWSDPSRARQILRPVPRREAIHEKGL